MKKSELLASIFVIVVVVVSFTILMGLWYSDYAEFSHIVRMLG